MTIFERHIIMEAIFGNNHRWLYEGLTADEWLTLGETRRTAGNQLAADAAYVISARLQGLDNNE